MIVQTAISGTTLPILCHAGFAADDRAGARLSYIYMSNITGSVLGAFITGFVLVDVFSTAAINAVLLDLTCLTVLGIVFVSNGTGELRGKLIAASIVLGLIGTSITPYVFSNFYEKIIYKKDTVSEPPFVDVVENKSGVINVTRDKTVFGSGMYDGRISVDLVDDVNGLIRPISLALYHPNPRHVLMIGLATGAWAQVIANHPSVEKLTIIEINPGYLSLIAEYPAVQSLFKNPKVDILIDDGRRWLNRNPTQHFDAIIQNTTWHFRPNVSSLLSAEYLDLSKRHLKSGGIMMFNTTGSVRSQLTACEVFEGAVREHSVMVVSQQQLERSPARLRKVLEEYQIDGHWVFDPGVPAQRHRIDEIVSDLDPMGANSQNSDGLWRAVEDCDSIRRRADGQPIITDDNMGEEWIMRKMSDPLFLPANPLRQLVERVLGIHR